MHTAKPLIQCAQWSWHRLFPEYALGLERVGCQVDRYTLRQDNDFDLDECFLDLSDDGISMKGFLKDHPELFILKAFTKSYGMAGVRLGYCLCSDNDLLTAMSKTAQPWNVSVLAQAAGVAALQEKQFLMKTKALIPVERCWLKNELEKLGCWVCPSKANYLLFYSKPGLHMALKKYGIAIRNCDNYHGLSSGWYRIAVRLHDQNEQLIAAVKRVCGKE